MKPRVLGAIVLAEQAVKEQGEELSAIFCHADLQGAVFNDSFQASVGLPLSIFPPAAAVWSGHYHKPQVLGGSLGDGSSPAYVEYVGSPIELSFAEEAQPKRLLLFSTPEPAMAAGARLPVSAGQSPWTRMGERLFSMFTPHCCSIFTRFYSVFPSTGRGGVAGDWSAALFAGGGGAGDAPIR